MQRLSRQGNPHQVLGSLIASARRRIKQAVGVLVRPHRLSPQQFWMLVHIAENEGMSLGELAERMSVDAPTASRVASALSRRGLTQVAGCVEDRRRCSLGLTARGRTLGRALLPLATRLRTAIWRGIDPADAEAAGRVMSQIAANMDRFEKPQRSLMSRRGAPGRGGHFPIGESHDQAPVEGARATGGRTR
jgi:DNA-binding MarR family transcriptional regulator